MYFSKNTKKVIKALQMLTKSDGYTTLFLLKRDEKIKYIKPFELESILFFLERNSYIRITLYSDGDCRINVNHDLFTIRSKYIYELKSFTIKSIIIPIIASVITSIITTCVLKFLLKM
ncbi:MAG: hypothetical protein Q4B52_04155 [Tissierellia bacterium]|nr:hypothetical protein [Tissierellia bacterium]